MTLSPDEKERIIEEETLRHEARMRAHRLHGALPLASDASCQHPACPHACRLAVWLVVTALLVALAFCAGGWHHAHYRCMDSSSRWMESQDERLPNADGMGDGGRSSMMPMAPKGHPKP